MNIIVDISTFHVYKSLEFNSILCIFPNWWLFCGTNFKGMSTYHITPKGGGFVNILHKASKNKCLVSDLCSRLFQGFRKKYPYNICLAGNRGFSAFSQFWNHLSRPIRSRIKFASKVVLILRHRQFLAS